MTDERVSHAPSVGVPALRAIALVGFMGAGKTTVGRALATRLGWRFEDLDELIQQREGSSIEQVFQQQGERKFRDLERFMMSQILTAANPGPMVLALGGGAFCLDEIQEMLRQPETPAIFLDAPFEELFRRSEQPGVVRPLRQDREQFRQLYEQRRGLYLEADLRIETMGKAVGAVVEEIMSELNLVATPVPRPAAERGDSQ